MSNPSRLDAAVQFLDALLTSASTDVVSPKDWWPRATAAIEAAAGSAEDFGAFTAKAAKKMQVESYSGTSSATIANLTVTLGEPTAFEEFRALCQRDAIYIAALVRAQRDANRKKKETAK